MKYAFFPKLVIFVNHHQEEHLCFFFSKNFLSPQTSRRGWGEAKLSYERPWVCRRNHYFNKINPNLLFTEGSHPTLNLSFVRALGFNMRSSISISGCPAHINPWLSMTEHTHRSHLLNSWEGCSTLVLQHDWCPFIFPFVLRKINGYVDSYCSKHTAVGSEPIWPLPRHIFQNIWESSVSILTNNMFSNHRSVWLHRA